MRTLEELSLCNIETTHHRTTSRRSGMQKSYGSRSTSRMADTNDHITGTAFYSTTASISSSGKRGVSELYVQVRLRVTSALGSISLIRNIPHSLDILRREPDLPSSHVLFEVLDGDAIVSLMDGVSSIPDIPKFGLYQG